MDQGTVARVRRSFKSGARNQRYLHLDFAPIG